MYLVRSVELENLSEADRLRRSLITHFVAPFAQDETQVENLRKLCESAFEREMYDELTRRGYRVTPQVRIGRYRIDMVVEGHNDARLAVECDGDQYHGPDKWLEDIHRQRVLERAGWVFWRCFASAFIRRRSIMLDDLLKTLAEYGIDPIGAEGAPRSIHAEHRVVLTITKTENHGKSTPGEVPDTIPAATAESPPVVQYSQESPAPQPGRAPQPSFGDKDTYDSSEVHNFSGYQTHTNVQQGLFDHGQNFEKSLDSNLPFNDYVEYAGVPGMDPRSCRLNEVTDGLVRIIQIEGPVIAKRVYNIYLRSCGVKRMGRELKFTMNRALSHAVRQGHVVQEDEGGKGRLLCSVVRMRGRPPINLRIRGPRSFDEIPPSELQVVARCLLERNGLTPGSDTHLRAILGCFDFRRLTTQVGTTLLEILARAIPYVDEFFSGMRK